MGKTSIQWTDFSWNPVRGCTRVSSGCGGPGPHGGCYAEAMAARFSQPGQWGHGFAEMRDGKPRWTGKVELIESQLDLPLRWKEPRKIFVNSTSDLFHESLPFVAIDRVFAVMALADQHTFQVLTKRPERMREYIATLPNTGEPDRITEIAADIGHSFRRGIQGSAGMCERPFHNLWLGTSVEDQATADERIPHLLATPAAVRFLSCEPLLGPIDLTRWLRPQEGVPGTCFDINGDRWHDRGQCPHCGPGLGWVITGGESGPNARVMLKAWSRSLRDQCASASTAYFHKQNGEWIDADEWDRRVAGASATPLTFAEAARLASLSPRLYQFEHHSDGSTMIRVGKKAAGRLLDGIEYNQFPTALQ